MQAAFGMQHDFLKLMLVPYPCAVEFEAFSSPPKSNNLLRGAQLLSVLSWCPGHEKQFNLICAFCSVLCTITVTCGCWDGSPALLSGVCIAWRFIFTTLHFSEAWSFQGIFKVLEDEPNPVTCMWFLPLWKIVHLLGFNYGSEKRTLNLCTFFSYSIFAWIFLFVWFCTKLRAM